MNDLRKTGAHNLCLKTSKPSEKLLSQLSEILSMHVYNDDDFTCSLKLNGKSELTYIFNRMILEATLE